MQLRQTKTLCQPGTGIDPLNSKVTAMCFSPDNMRLAIATMDRVVSMYDENGERVDKFSTKPNGKGPKNYVVRCHIKIPLDTYTRAMQFCSDINYAKLAIAQSDNIVFVYKWASEPGQTINGKNIEGASSWLGKKSICNKLPEASSVTCLVWPSKRTAELAYGLADGKIKIGYLRSNKSQSLYQSDSYAVAITANLEGTEIASSHLDGSIYTCSIPAKGSEPIWSKLTSHPCPAYALAWGRDICAAGNDGKVVFYDSDGTITKMYSYGDQSDNSVQSREFSTASFNGNGESVVVGNFDCFRTYSWSTSTHSWEEATLKVVKNMYSVTALSWKPNGSLLAVGSACGMVDLYDAYIRRFMYKNSFEITYVSPSQVYVQPKDDVNAKMTVLHSTRGQEIVKVSIFQDTESKLDRYVVGHTTDTLMLCDMDSPTTSSSEVEWFTSGHGEKFLFDTPNAWIIFHAGEISIIEYGTNKVLCSIRTEHSSGHLLSVRMNERPKSASNIDLSTGTNKKVAYLLDKQTICVKDMLTNAGSTINHDGPIDFVELNAKGTLLLFRDKTRMLHLFDVITQTRSTLLQHCDYVQWVPGSDVIVAQHQSSMCVWYNVRIPDQVTMREINGEIEGIERSNGKTEVIVAEASRLSSYLLAEELIAFGTAIDDHNYITGIEILQSMELSPQTEAMWEQLQDACIEGWNFNLAERCAAAVGDVGRARCFHRMAKHAKSSKEAGLNVHNNWKVKAKMLEMQKLFGKAEEVYLAHNRITEAIGMYENMSMFAEAINVAERKHHPKANDMKAAYFRWLLDTNQEEAAAAQKESECDYIHAVELYLNAGIPAKAAHIITENGIVQPTSLLERIALALEDADMYAIAGNVHERMGQREKALDCFRLGHEYQEATELARNHFPSKVVSLELDWGDHLFATGKADAAIEHYVQAHAHTKAMKAALSSRQWKRAASLANHLDPDSSGDHFVQLAQHYAEMKQHSIAEKWFVKANQPGLAVSMYLEASMSDSAERLASWLSELEAASIYISRAENMEQSKNLQEAEMMYLKAHRIERAICMYKQHEQFDELLSLVSKYKPELLNETKIYVGQELEMKKDTKGAETNYCSAGEWYCATKMYLKQQMWDDAIRVARIYGDVENCRKIAYECITQGGGKKWTATGANADLTEMAIDYAMGNGAFESALELAVKYFPEKVKDIHYQRAMILEDEGQLADAEAEFIKANMLKEAIDMYKHQGDWKEAFRLAANNPEYTNDLYIAQAQASIDKNDIDRAESMFIKAGRPELAVQMFQDSNRWEDALRVCKVHLPHKQNEVLLQYQNYREAVKERNMSSFDVEENYSGILSTLEPQNNIESPSQQSYNRGVASTDNDGFINGSVKSELDGLAQTGQWEALWETCFRESIPQEAVSNYAALRVRELVAKDNTCIEEALMTLEKCGTPQTGTSFGIYRDIAVKLLGLDINQENDLGQSLLVEKLRGTLARVVNNLGELNTSDCEQFQKLLMAVHLTHMHNTCREYGLDDLGMKCAIALLGFSSFIPADKLFFIAGQACRHQQETNLAFMLLNRYVDLVEAIEEGDLCNVDNEDFASATNISADIEVPGRQYLPSEEAREEVRDWVLSRCMDSNIDHTLPEVSEAEDTIYAALYMSDKPICIITGFPISHIDMIEVGDRKANRNDWNKFVNKTGMCPWTGAAADPM